MSQSVGRPGLRGNRWGLDDSFGGLASGVAVCAVVAIGLVAVPSLGAQGPMCFGEPATIVAQRGVPTIGTSGSDVIVGTSGDDVIRGRGGADLICSKGGDDDVKGGSGADQISLGKGDDTAEGGKGADYIEGNSGRDTIRGNSGGDQVLGGKGRDVLRGDKGSDLVHGGTGKDLLIGGSAADQMRGGKGDDDCRGGSGIDVFASCNEPTVDDIDLDAIFVDTADLGGDWAVTQPVANIPSTTPLLICGTDIENQIGIRTPGIWAHWGSASLLTQFGQVVRIHTERTASEVIEKITRLADDDCGTWEERDPANTATLTLENADPLDVTPMGEEFAQFHYDLHIDPDDPAMAESNSNVVMLFMRCGPVLSRHWFWYPPGVVTAELVDTHTALVHAELKAAVEAEGFDCPDSPPTS